MKWSLTCIVLAVALSLGVMGGNPYAGEMDEEKGVVLSEDVGEEAEAHTTTCTLTIAPGTVTNGQVFSFGVQYHPCLAIGTWQEKFIFNWPSSAEGFREQTIRQKLFVDEPGCVSASSEIAVVPSATGIKGTFEAKLEVRGVCSAKARMTVQ